MNILSSISRLALKAKRIRRNSERWGLNLNLIFIGMVFQQEWNYLSSQMKARLLNLVVPKTLKCSHLILKIKILSPKKDKMKWISGQHHTDHLKATCAQVPMVLKAAKKAILQKTKKIFVNSFTYLWKSTRNLRTIPSENMIPWSKPYLTSCLTILTSPKSKEKIFLTHSRRLSTSVVETPTSQGPSSSERAILPITFTSF